MSGRKEGQSVRTYLKRSKRYLTNFGKDCYNLHIMSTVNISLPSQQVNIIDAFVQKYGFANRSELFRSLLRLVISKPDLIDHAATFPFISPKEQSAKKILSDFRKSKKYSKTFLKDLKEGLESSDYFK